jgi:hypothetical protein
MNILNPKTLLKINMVVLLVKKILFGIIRLVNGIMLQSRLIRKKFKNVVHVPNKTRKYQDHQPKIYIALPNLDN